MGLFDFVKGAFKVKKALDRPKTKKLKPKIERKSSKKKNIKKKSIVKKKAIKKRVAKKVTKKKVTKKKVTKKKVTKKKVTKKKVTKKKVTKKKETLKPPREKEIGRVVHYFGKISVGVIELRSSLKVGDEIHIEGVNDNFKQVIKSIQVNHQDIANARAGDDVGLKVKKPVHVNDKVYKIIKN